MKENYFLRQIINMTTEMLQTIAHNEIIHLQNTVITLNLREDILRYDNLRRLILNNETRCPTISRKKYAITPPIYPPNRNTNLIGQQTRRIS